MKNPFPKGFSKPQEHQPSLLNHQAPIRYYAGLAMSNDDSSLSRYSRQIRFAGLGEVGQQHLKAGRAVICGCGALGSVSANQLVRAGVGFVRIIDRDFVDLSNLHRQSLYDEEDVAQMLPKAEAAARKLRAANSEVKIEAVVADLSAGNIESLCGDADVILDGTDNFETRFLLNDFACREVIPWIYAGCVGSLGQTMTIIPGESACLRCLLDAPPPAGATETCETAGVIAPISSLIASMQSAEAIKLLAGRRSDVSAVLFSIDLWNNTVQRLSSSQIREHSDCPICRHGRFDWLEGRIASHAIRLCGRDAVQVIPPAGTTVDWPALQDRLKLVAEVAANEFLLRFQVDGCRVSVFRDGRAIFQGVARFSTALALYARYISS